MEEVFSLELRVLTVNDRLVVLMAISATVATTTKAPKAGGTDAVPNPALTARTDPARKMARESFAGNMNFEFLTSKFMQI